MLPNFDQKVTFGETKIKGLGREEEGEQGRKRESIVGCQPHWPQYKKGAETLSSLSSLLTYLNSQGSMSGTGLASE